MLNIKTLVKVNVFTCDATNITQDCDSLLSFLLKEEYKQLKIKQLVDFIGYKLDEDSILTFFPIKQSQIYSAIFLFHQSKNAKKRVNVLFYNTKIIANNDDLRELFKQLSKLPSTQHPSVVILVQSNETKDTLVALLSKENKVNRRLITVINNFECTERIRRVFFKHLLNFVAYYNQMDKFHFSFDESEEVIMKPQTQKINFIVCGKAGVGKSSLINELFQDQLSLEGELLSCTQKIVQYTHEELPLSIYDTPGIEKNKIADDVLQHIDDVFKSNDPRKKIHMLFYLCNAQARDLLDVDKYFLSALTKWKKETNIQLPVTFIITKSKTPTNGKEMKDTLKRGLKSINFNESDEIYPIELGDTYDNSNYFGMKDLVTKLVEHFEPDARPELIASKIQQASSESQITNFIQSNVFFRDCNMSPKFIQQRLSEFAHQLVFLYSLFIDVFNDQAKEIECLEDIAHLYDFPISKGEIVEFLNNMDESKKEHTKEIEEIIPFHFCLFKKAECFIRLMDSKVEIITTRLKGLLLKTVEDLNKAIEGLKQFLVRFEKNERVEEDKFHYES